MEIEEFRRQAHATVEWMADYLEGIEELPVMAGGAPGEVLAQLPPAAPAAGEPMERIMDDFRRIVLPAMTHWQHPSFFAYFPANSSPPSVLAEMITATLGAQCMSWLTSPAAAELEQRVMDWLRDMSGLPAGFTGVIQDTASTATLCAIVSARERTTGLAGNARGLDGLGTLTVYCSAETHSSIEKDVRIAGMGSDNLRRIAVDDAYAMDPAALDAAIAEDKAAGRKPVCVIATIGTTGSSAIDPLEEIAAVCKRHGVWLHVDAAYAGSAMLVPENRWMIAGVEGADSYVFNPHKWLFTNFDCSAYFVRDAEHLIRTFGLTAEYLRTTEDRRVNNYRDWGIPLGRRFRALKLWFVIRAYGADGLRRRIARHMELARDLERSIGESADFEMLAPVPLALLCFRHRPPGVADGEALDRLNEALVERLNATGKLFLTHTRLGGAYAVRLSIGQTTTEARHGDAAWRLIQDTARTLV